MQSDSLSTPRVSSHPWNGGLEFRALAECVPSLIFVTDRDGLNVYTNAQFQRYTGLRGERLLGNEWLTIIHEGDRQRAASTWDQCCESECSYEARYRFLRFDGEYRWHLVRGEPVRDANGEVLRWIGSCTDIHDLVSGTANNDRAQAILDGLGHAQGVLICAKDSSGKYVFSNDACLNVLGLRPCEAIGADPTDTATNDLEAEVIRANDRLVRETNKASVFEESWTTPSLGTRYFRSTRMPLLFADGSVGVTVCSVDVTAEKVAETEAVSEKARYGSRIDTLPIITWVADQVGTIIEVNQAWRDHSGISIGEEWEFDEIVAPQNLKAYLDQWDFCLQTGELFDYVTVVSDALTRQEVTRRVIAIPLCNTDGGSVRWYGSMF